MPLEAREARKRNICAFAWKKAGTQTLVIAPRLVAKLTQNGAISPVGPAAWDDSALLLPGRPQTRAYRNIFTGEITESIVSGRRAALPLAKVLAIFPVAVLEMV